MYYIYIYIYIYIHTLNADTYIYVSFSILYFRGALNYLRPEPFTKCQRLNTPIPKAITERLFWIASCTYLLAAKRNQNALILEQTIRSATMTHYADDTMPKPWPSA